jgi:hypothetical protein
MGDRATPPDEQLPRVHRPPLPRSVRAACVLEIDENNAVTIKQIDLRSSTAPGRRADRPQPPRASARAERRGRRSGRRGSPRSAEPAGHRRSSARRDGRRASPLRRPDFKISRRRAAPAACPGRVEFRYGVDVGVDVRRPSCRDLDAVVLATGSRAARPPVQDARLDGVHFAWSTSTTRTARSPGSARGAHRGRQARDRDRRRRHGR